MSENMIEFFKNNEFTMQMKQITNSFSQENYNCNYFNHSNFNKVLSEHNADSLKVTNFNIRSFEKNKFKFYYYLCTLPCQFDIIFLTETGKVNIEWAESIFEGYKFLYQPPISNKGGAGMLIKKNSFDNFSEIIDDKYCVKKICDCRLCEVESIWVKLENNGKEFITGSIYRHPNGNVKHFVESIEHIFSNVNDNTFYIIAGDFNINLLNINDENTTKYVNSFLEANFIPCINLPTRFCETTATLIDHIMLKVPRKLIQSKVSAGNLLADITDHLPNFVFINTKIEIKNKRPYVRLFTKRKIAKFLAESENTSPMVSLNNGILAHENASDSYREFITNFRNLLEEYFPLVKLSRSKAKNKPFVTSGIRVSIKHRDRLYQKYLNNKTDLNRRIHKKYANKVTDLLRKSEIMYYKKQLKDHSGNSQSLWKVFGKILNNKKSSSHIINKIRGNNRVITNNDQIAQEFNKYFCGIGEKLAKDFDNTNSVNHKTYLRNKIERSFYFHEITESELEKEINKLDNKKTPGYDDISVKFIKLCGPLVTKPLVMIFNQSILTGEYPNELKIAKVVPLFKKGDKSLVSNYQPISLLSIINKIFEKLIYNRLYKFLIKHNILYKYQFGFRKGYSTDMALIEIVDNIKTAIDNNKYVCGIFLDLTKAFDTVNHQILLDKLHHYGVRGIVHDLFKSYLSNRKQFVKVNNTTSEYLPTNCGVPQGSVLGPLLFLIYVNDIANLSPLGSIRLFADDTNIFIEHENIEQLRIDAQSVLEYIYKWFGDNRLTVNTSKSNFSIFTTTYKRNNNLIPDSLVSNKGTILISDSTKYLGVTIDENLNWKKHVNNVCNSLKSLFPIFYNIRKYLSDEQVKALYYNLVYSRIKYGLVVYGSSDSSIIKPIQTLQNQLLKVLTEKPYRYSTNKLHNELKVIKVCDIYKQDALSFVFNYYKNKLPPTFDNFFTLFSDIHGYCTRNRNHSFILPQYSNVFGSSALKVEGVRLWNALDSEIKSKNTIKSFRKSLKETYLPYPVP